MPNNLTFREECLYTLGEVERELVELVVASTLHTHLHLFVLFQLYGCIFEKKALMLTGTFTGNAYYMSEKS